MTSVHAPVQCTEELYVRNKTLGRKTYFFYKNAENWTRVFIISYKKTWTVNLELKGSVRQIFILEPQARRYGHFWARKVKILHFFRFCKHFACNTVAAITLDLGLQTQKLLQILDINAEESHMLRDK